MGVLFLTYLLIAPSVLMLGEALDVRRPFVNHNNKQLTAELLSSHDYKQFTAEVISYGYSNITLSLPGSESLSLVARQECQDPGYVPCSNEAGCCQAGDNCVPGGCCPAGQEKCSSNGCYDPITEVCCANSNSCLIGEDCVAGGGCCPKGEIRCGSSNKCYNPDTDKCCQANNTLWACPASSSCCGGGGCYDPITEVCCPDSHTCPMGYDCVAGGHCCPSGQLPCGSNKCYDPNKDKCCQASNSVWACPSTSSCCNVGYCNDPDSEICCTGGSCAKEDSCCEFECCTSIANCGSDGFCTRKVSATPTPSSARSSSSSQTKAPAFSTPKISTPSPTSTQTSTQTSCTPSPLPTGASPSDPGDYLLVNGDCLPVMDFVPVDGLTEELIESICGGIQQQKAPAKLSNSIMVLTWQGFRTQTPACTGLCTNKIDPRYNERQTCDEFPFGSTVEGGGAGAHVMCIVWWQNTLQGNLIQRYNAFYNIRANDKFVVRVLPSCDSFISGGSKRGIQDLHRRQTGQPNSQTIGNETILSSSYNIWQPDPMSGAENGTGFIFAPFGEVGPGVFNTKLSLKGSVGGLRILDGDGIEYYSITNPTDSEAMTFNVSADDDLSISAPAAQNTTANISYTCTVSPLPSNTSSSKSGASHTEDFMRPQFVEFLLLLVMMTWAFIF